MKLICAIVLLLIRISGSPAPTGSDAFAPLAPVSPSALCAAIEASVGSPRTQMGEPWQPGSTQTADCWTAELNVQ